MMLNPVQSIEVSAALLECSASMKLTMFHNYLAWSANDKVYSLRMFMNEKTSRRPLSHNSMQPNYYEMPIESLAFRVAKGPYNNTRVSQKAKPKSTCHMIDLGCLHPYPHFDIYTSGSSSKTSVITRLVVCVSRTDIHFLLAYAMSFSSS